MSIFAQMIKLWLTSWATLKLKLHQKATVWLLFTPTNQKWRFMTLVLWDNFSQRNSIGTRHQNTPSTGRFLTWNFTLSIHKPQIQASIQLLGCFSESMTTFASTLRTISTLSMVIAIIHSFSPGTSETKCSTTTKGLWLHHPVLRQLNGSSLLRFTRSQGRISRRSKQPLTMEIQTQGVFSHWTEEGR